MAKYKAQCREKGLPDSDEIAVLFAMLPQQVEALLKPKAAAPAAAAPAPAAAPAAPVSSGNGRGKKMVVTINGARHDVSVETL